MIWGREREPDQESRCARDQGEGEPQRDGDGGRPGEARHGHSGCGHGTSSAKGLVWYTCVYYNYYREWRFLGGWPRDPGAPGGALHCPAHLSGWPAPDRCRSRHGSSGEPPGTTRRPRPRHRPEWLLSISWLRALPGPTGGVRHVSQLKIGRDAMRHGSPGVTVVQERALLPGVLRHHDRSAGGLYLRRRPLPRLHGCLGTLRPIDALTSVCSTKLAEAITGPGPRPGMV